MLLKAMAALAVLVSSPASGQPLPVLSTSIETGWTSNAEDAAGGGGDVYVTHVHDIGLAAEGLRGAITLQSTRYERLWRENDWAVSLVLEGESRLAPETSLRGSLLLSYGEEGRAAASIWGPIGLVTPQVSGRAFLRSETGLGDALLGLDLAYALGRPGDTRVEAGLLPDSRTEAQTDTVTAGVDLLYPVTPTAALAARAQYRTILVPDEDQALFGRIPVSILRLGGGIEAGAGTAASLLLRGGIDLVTPPELIVPYAEAQARLQVSDVLALHATLLAGADSEDPADGLVDWMLEARGGAILMPLPGLELEAGLFWARTRSPALDLAIETERGAELIARWSALQGLRLDALARYRQVEGLMPSYEETRLALRISAAI